jgi:hypothetical protein
MQRYFLLRVGRPFHLWCCGVVVSIACRSVQDDSTTVSAASETDSERQEYDEQSSDGDGDSDQNKDSDQESETTVETDTLPETDSAFVEVDTDTESQAVCIEYALDSCCLHRDPLSQCELLDDDDCIEYVTYICCSGLSYTCSGNYCSPPRGSTGSPSCTRPEWVKQTYIPHFSKLISHNLIGNN